MANPTLPRGLYGLVGESLRRLSLVLWGWVGSLEAFGDVMASLVRASAKASYGTYLGRATPLGFIAWMGCQG